MKKRTLALLLGVILTASMAIPFNSCTGYLDFAGNVYEWTNAPAGSTSKIIEAEELPQGYEVKPLEGVAVSANDEDESHPFTMISDEEGYFHEGLTVELDENIIMGVNQSGYGGATLEFDVEKETYFYSFIVLLVPNK